MTDAEDDGAGPPVNIKVQNSGREMAFHFADGSSFVLGSELLRVESPSAEVQGHGIGEKKILAGRRHVAVIGVEPVGQYAIRITFDDLHDTGLYGWNYLRHLHRAESELWADYLTGLERAGYSRDP